MKAVEVQITTFSGGFIVSDPRILSRFFSQSNFEKMLKEDRSIEGFIYNTMESQKLTNCTIIEQMYARLRNDYRNEYYYKNTLFNRHVLGRHSLNTTSAITELPIHHSKADFIKINGEAVVYEIKTELDSFIRLNSQINDYYKAFTKVYVVTSESQSAKALELLKETSVGVLVLTTRDYFSERKRADVTIQNLNYRTIFGVLRKYEFEEIIEDYFGTLPEVAPAFYYDACYEQFRQIPMNELHPVFVQLLKQRNKVESPSFIKDIPYEIRSLAYFSSFIRKNNQCFHDFLNYKRG